MHTPTTALALIQASAEFALASGAPFDLKRCVDLCREAARSSACSTCGGSGQHRPLYAIEIVPCPECNGAAR
jgi:DnaJ-class molecular chaperone